MITKKKQRIIEGIQNNLFAKTLGYPTVSVFSSCKLNQLYKIDFIDHSVVPEIKNGDDLLQDLFKWFEKEITDRKIASNNIEECILDVEIQKSRFLIFGYRTYKFNLRLITPLKVNTKSQTVKGWL